MNYAFNPAKSYENGRLSGYAEGYAKGFATARDRSIELFCDVSVMLLAEEGWNEDQIQEFADRLTHGVKYAWQYPEDFSIKKRQTYANYDITVHYGDEDAVEENEGR